MKNAKYNNFFLNMLEQKWPSRSAQDNYDYLYDWSLKTTCSVPSIVEAWEEAMEILKVLIVEESMANSDTI